MPVTDGLQSLSSSSSYPPYMDTTWKKWQADWRETGYTTITGMMLYNCIPEAKEIVTSTIYRWMSQLSWWWMVSSFYKVIDVNTGKSHYAQLGSRHQSSNVSWYQPSGWDQSWLGLCQQSRQSQTRTSSLNMRNILLLQQLITDAPYNFPHSQHQFTTGTVFAMVKTTWL